jgi:hypothetical protein
MVTGVVLTPKALIVNPVKACVKVLVDDANNSPAPLTPPTSSTASWATDSVERLRLVAPVSTTSRPSAPARLLPTSNRNGAAGLPSFSTEAVIGAPLAVSFCTTSVSLSSASMATS